MRCEVYPFHKKYLSRVYNYVIIKCVMAILSRSGKTLRTRYILVVIILATIPCYCAGLVYANSKRAQGTPTATPLASLTWTSSPSPFPTNTRLPFNTFTPTLTPTITLTLTISITPSPFMTPTQTASLTPTVTATFTDTPSPTVTSSPTNTSTVTNTLTFTPETPPVP